MKKRKIVWSAGTAAVVAALVFAAAGFAAPRAKRFDGAGRAPLGPASSARNGTVAPVPTPVADVSAASSGTQIVTAEEGASAPSVAQLPNAAAAPLRPALPARPSGPLWFGLYVPGAPASMKPLAASESRIGGHAEVVNFFVSDYEKFPASRCANIVAHGSTPLVTLEFWSVGSAGLDAITDGSRDASIRRFARDAKAFGKEIWLRPFHEMNTRHYPWAAKGSNTPAKLIAAYRHVYRVFAAEGATNVKFVWSPNIDYNVASYYPGDAYVDYAAIDGYNTGKPWRSFSDLFGDTYAAMCEVTPRPIFIAETACAESPGKAAWIADMFDEIARSYPRIAGICWFDSNKEQDWRLNSSPGSIAAVRAALAES